MHKRPHLKSLTSLARLACASGLVALLGGCASTPVDQPVQARAAVESLFSDADFTPPARAVHSDDALLLTPEMSDYLRQFIQPLVRKQGAREALLDALYTRGHLQLRYDAENTRSAAQAFAVRAGNCMSLVLMTAAFAQAMDVPVQFQSVQVPETWGRDGDLLVFYGHVNIGLGLPMPERKSRLLAPEWRVVDFLPGIDLRNTEFSVISQDRVLAMYANNHAAELLSRGQTQEAYWWARESVQRDPSFAVAFNTLGVIYLRAGLPQRAEAALRRALGESPDNPHTLTNLADVLQRLGRPAEAQQALAQAKALQQATAFALYQRSQQAVRDGQLLHAQRLVEQALRLDPTHHELHFALANILAAQGNTEAAGKALAQAQSHSESKSLQAKYAAKLQRLTDAQPH